MAISLLNAPIRASSLLSWQIKSHPRSMSGVELEGNNLAKKAYIDESGISQERVSVVAGVIIDSDLQLMDVAEEIQRLIDEFVPLDHRSGFEFHGKKLFHKLGPVPEDRCHDALRAVLSLPSKFRIPVSFGFIRKPSWREMPREASEAQKRQRANANAGLYHAIAFSMCALGIERFMREDSKTKELVDFTVETTDHTKRDIDTAYNAMKGILDSKKARQIWDVISKKHPELLPIKKIVDTPNFVRKGGAPAIQIADVCAMTIRHCLEGRSDALTFIETLSAGAPERIHANGYFLKPDIRAGYNIVVLS